MHVRSKVMATVCRVLVVEDDHDSAEILCILLRGLGHVAQDAHSGRAAIEELPRFRPDVMLVDLGLPDMSGHDVARAARAWAGRRKIYLAALSGWQMKEHTTEASPFERFLLKPAAVGAVAASIEEAVRRLSRERREEAHGLDPQATEHRRNQ